MVIAGLTPREAVRAVEARLSAAGCPDADYDARELFRVAAGRDARLSDRVLTTEEAEKLEALCTRREQRDPLQLPAMQAKMWFSFFVVLYRPMSAGWHIAKMRFCRQARF